MGHNSSCGRKDRLLLPLKSSYEAKSLSPDFIVGSSARMSSHLAMTVFIVFAIPHNMMMILIYAVISHATNVSPCRATKVTSMAEREL